MNKNYIRQNMNKIIYHQADFTNQDYHFGIIVHKVFYPMIVVPENLTK